MGSILVKLIFRGVIHSKKNSKQIIKNRRTGRLMVISSNKAREMESEMTNQFISQIGMCHRVPSDEPVSVTINIWEESNRRHDLDNQATSILDALVAAGVVPDDCVKYIQELNVYFAGVDRDDPRAEIEIKERKGE